MLATAVAQAPWILVGGKGGVGKTTIAASLAIELADAGERVLVLSVDPAHSLGDALSVSLGPEPRDVPGVSGLRAMEVDAALERARWLERHRNALAELIEGGTYLAHDEVEELLDLALPGADELAAMLRLAELAGEQDETRLVIDTAPTGHALRLIETPALAADWAAALDALDARRRAVAEAMTRGSVAAADRVRAFLDELSSDIAALSSRLRNPERTRALLVTNVEPMVLAETRRYHQALEDAGITVAALVVNRVEPGAAGAGELAEITGLRPLHVPRFPRDPCGAADLRQLAAAVSEGPPAVRASREQVPTSPERPGLRPSAGLTKVAERRQPQPEQMHGRVHVAGRWRPPEGRRLYIVAGKGGVGKTTVASALAALLAEEVGARTLLLGVDPAGSIGDAWSVDVTDAPQEAPGQPRLLLRQLDADAAWESFRESYREGLAGVLADVVGDQDGSVADRMVELVPPGLDELVALAELARLAEDTAYDSIVLDTAPTGHFLRLLEAPSVARAWAHAVLRLMLRYREVAGLGEPAERVLRFAREVRRLEELLRDRSQTFVAIVALPEALSVSESARLLDRLRERRVAPEAMFVNRLLAGDDLPDPAVAARAAELLSLATRPPAVATRNFQPGPRGAEALLAFARSWRCIVPDAPAESAA